MTTQDTQAMKQMTKAPGLTLGAVRGLIVITLAWCLAAPVSLADPLHKFGNDGAWRHEHSGWMFPKQIGDFVRVGAPYTIDGNNDAGAQYERAPLAAAVEVYAVDSGAEGAVFDNAKAAAARKAGESAKLKSEAPFELAARDQVRAVKVTYTAEVESQPWMTNLYFVETQHWIVKVIVSTPAADEDADKALDAFVQELPWDTLGAPGTLH